MIFQVQVEHLLSKLKIFDSGTLLFYLNPIESKLILMTESFQSIYLVSYISDEENPTLLSDKCFGVELSDLKPLLKLTKRYSQEILNFVYNENSNFLTVYLPTQVTLNVVALPYTFAEAENNFIPLPSSIPSNLTIDDLMPIEATPLLRDWLKLKKNTEEVFLAKTCAVFTSPTDITIVHFTSEKGDEVEADFRTVSKYKDLNVPALVKFLNYNYPTGKNAIPLLICTYTEIPNIWWSHSTGLSARIKAVSVDPSEYFYQPYGKTLTKIHELQSHYSSFQLQQDEVDLLYSRYKATCSASQKGVIHLYATNKLLSVFVYNDKAEEIARLEINIECQEDLDLFLNLNNFSTLLSKPEALNIKYLDRMYPCIIEGKYFTSYFMPVIFFDRRHSNV